MSAVRVALHALGVLVALAVVAGSVLAFLAFGGRLGAPARTPAPLASVVAEAAASRDAPAAFVGRPAFRSCGRIALRDGGGIPAARIECLAAAPAEGRELVVVSTTASGDPVVRWFRTGPDLDGVEIFADRTAERSGGWHRSLCRSGRIDQVGACA